VKKVCLVVYSAFTSLLAIFPFAAVSQIPISSGAYSDNFDLLGTISCHWTNNLTLPGWYASKGNTDATNYIAGAGTVTTGGLYSFGTNGTAQQLRPGAWFAGWSFHSLRFWCAIHQCHNLAPIQHHRLPHGRTMARWKQQHAPSLRLFMAGDLPIASLHPSLPASCAVERLPAV